MFLFFKELSDNVFFPFFRIEEEAIRFQRWWLNKRKKKFSFRAEERNDMKWKCVFVCLSFCQDIFWKFAFQFNFFCFSDFLDLCFELCFWNWNMKKLRRGFGWSPKKHRYARKKSWSWSASKMEKLRILNDYLQKIIENQPVVKMEKLRICNDCLQKIIENQLDFNS